jgi:glutamine cyclotransferase
MQLLSLIVLIVGLVCVGADSGYRIINKYPHDSSAFTQGLFIDPNQPQYFFEGFLNLSILRTIF